MRIIEENAETVINELSVHDALFKKLNYHFSEKVISFDLVDLEWDKVITKLRFNNVIGFTMDASAPWGGTNMARLLDWEVIAKEQQVLLPILYKEAERYKLGAYLDTRKELRFFETIFAFSTGDVLRIVCESIDVVVTPIESKQE